MNIAASLWNFPTDHSVSPYTGLTRASWVEIGRGLLDGALRNTQGMSARLTFPCSLAAGYPRINAEGLMTGTEEAYLEGYARTLMLAAALLVDEPELKLQGRGVADYYSEFLLRGVNRFDTASFGWLTSPEPNQRIVEAAALTISLSVARESLWEPLSRAERATVARWLAQFKEIAVYGNNWLWFIVLINTFLKREGYGYSQDRVQNNLEAICKLHVDAGWFIDQDKFDFYSAWALQFYPIFWAAWDGETYPTLRDEFYLRNDQFLLGYQHVFSREGFMPLWGRSICYRFAAASPLAVAFMRPTLPKMDPSFARRLCSGNLLQFITHPEFLKNGVPSLGFYGEDRRLIDNYSCSASPFWCSKLFLAVILPKESPFWRTPENEGFWDSPPARFNLGQTGMWVEHDRDTGHSRLFAPQNVRHDDQRYSSPSINYFNMKIRFLHFKSENFLLTFSPSPPPSPPLGRGEG